MGLQVCCILNKGNEECANECIICMVPCTMAAEQYTRKLKPVIVGRQQCAVTSPVDMVGNNPHPFPQPKWLRKAYAWTVGKSYHNFPTCRLCAESRHVLNLECREEPMECMELSRECNVLPGLAASVTFMALRVRCQS
jgi:hypothetical protein